MSKQRQVLTVHVTEYTNRQLVEVQFLRTGPEKSPLRGTLKSRASYQRLLRVIGPLRKFSTSSLYFANLVSLTDQGENR